MAVRDINYLSKDFTSIKSDLIDYVKRHFPSDWRDFNDASGGMALLELMAYVGDVLSFNIDRQVNEAYITRAVETKNIVSLAKNFGYTPKNTTPAVVNLSISADLNESTSGETLFTLKKGATVFTNFEPIVSFETLNDVDFAQPKDRIVKPLSQNSIPSNSDSFVQDTIMDSYEHNKSLTIKDFFNKQVALEDRGAVIHTKDMLD